MKTLIKYFVLRDERGAGISGKTVVAYPAGTSAHGTTASDLGYGRYKFVIEPTSKGMEDDLKISRLYDIRVNSVLYQESVDLGQWQWYVSELEIATEQGAVSFNFTDLTDENGDGLPTIIENAQIDIFPQTNRAGYISAQSTTAFTITLTTGDADPGVFDAHIKVIK